MVNSDNVIAEVPHRDQAAIGGIGIDQPPLETLPREIIRSVSWSQVAWTIAATLFVLGALNFLAGAYLSRYTSNQGYWLIKHKWELLERVDHPIDWLIIGDSSCNQGIDTETWDRALGGRSLNLCTIGDLLLLNGVWMLAALSERIGSPPNVLVVHVHDMWHRRPTPELLGRIPVRGVWGKGNTSVVLTLSETARELLSRYAPLVSQSSALRNSLRNPSTLFETKFVLGDNGYMREVEANPQTVERDAAAHLRALETQAFNISAENRAALEELGALADAHEVDIYLTSAPIFEGLLASPAFREHVAPMQAEFRVWDASNPRLHYIDEFQAFPKESMQNADHLIHDAAQVYTRRLAEIVR